MKPRRQQFGDVPFDLASRNHFIVETWGNGFAVTVRRRGQQPETVLASTPGEVNRLRQQLSESGLIGFNARAA